MYACAKCGTETQNFGELLCSYDGHPAHGNCVALCETCFGECDAGRADWPTSPWEAKRRHDGDKSAQ